MTWLLTTKCTIYLKISIFDPSEVFSIRIRQTLVQNFMLNNCIANFIGNADAKRSQPHNRHDGRFKWDNFHENGKNGGIYSHLLSRYSILRCFNNDIVHFFLPLTLLFIFVSGKCLPLVDSVCVHFWSKLVTLLFLHLNRSKRLYSRRG